MYFSRETKIPNFLTCKKILIDLVHYQINCKYIFETTAIYWLLADQGYYTHVSTFQIVRNVKIIILFHMETFSSRFLSLLLNYYFKLLL